jgi:chromosome segregation ATPase
VLRDGVRPEPSTTVKFQEVEEMRQEVTIGKSQKERELEQIIESLKKVVARLSSENENLKKNMVSTNRSMDKPSHDKTLKDRIASLEEEVRELRAREEINRDLESKLKRVNKENNDLRGELERELKRVDDSDSKYRALLVQYDVMTKDNERLRRALDELTS